jgi:hypothetical protein
VIAGPCWSRGENIRGETLDDVMMIFESVGGGSSARQTGADEPTKTSVRTRRNAANGPDVAAPHIRGYDAGITGRFGRLRLEHLKPSP